MSRYKLSMKNFIKHIFFGVKWSSILLCMLFLVLKPEIQAQYISNNGAYVSISNGTVISLDTINSDNASTIENGGTITINTLILKERKYDFYQL